MDNVYNVDIVAGLLGAFEQAVLLTVWRLADGRLGSRHSSRSSGLSHPPGHRGAVYATLDRLEAKSLLDSHLEEGTPARAGRLRRYYHLTAEGVSAMNESRAALERMWRGAKWPLESRA